MRIIFDLFNDKINIRIFARNESLGINTMHPHGQSTYYAQQNILLAGCIDDANHFVNDIQSRHKIPLFHCLSLFVGEAMNMN